MGLKHINKGQKKYLNKLCILTFVTLKQNKQHNIMYLSKEMAFHEFVYNNYICIV